MKKTFVLLLIITLSMMVSCENRSASIDETILSEKDFSVLSENPSIGEVHNYLLDMAHKNMPSLRSSDGKIDMKEVLDLWFSSDYIKSQNVSEEDRDIVYNNVLWFVNELKNRDAKTPEDVSTFFQELVPAGNTRAYYNGVDVYQDVFEHSTEYWNSYLGNNLRGSGNAVIIADAAGSLWGLWGGAIGSILAGGAASLMANNPEAVKRVAAAYDWKCNPKFI